MCLKLQPNGLNALVLRCVFLALIEIHRSVAVLGAAEADPAELLIV